MLFKFDGAPLDSADFGWYMGWVSNAVSEAEKKKHPDVNFDVWYCNNETNNTVPYAFDKKLRAKDAVAKIACGLTPIVWGVDKTWVVLKPPAGRETWPHGTKPAAMKEGAGEAAGAGAGAAE